ncbi:MAG: AraC family transcriptional regulator [Verrucomicrobiae bacterium]|nr:AraC family transcriptional regulator [Verrucomicrobiae bacterium]
MSSTSDAPLWGIYTMISGAPAPLKRLLLNPMSFPVIFQSCTRLRGENQIPISNRPMTEIALLCGFSDSNYFSRQFRRVMGQSPRDFRKQR